MWCSTCRTDVSVRTTGHAGGLLCSQCGHDLLAASKPTDAIRQAREILERWNSSDLFERISRTESLDSLQTRLDSSRKPAQRTSSLTKALDFSPPVKVPTEAGPSIPLTILKAPLTPEDLASISPKYFRDSEEATTPPQDKETAETEILQVAAPEELIDSSSDHEASDRLQDDVVDSVHSDDNISDASLGSDQSEIPNVAQEPNATPLAETETAPEEIQHVSADTGAPVTIHGITSQLQRVYELALAQEAKLLADEQNESTLVNDQCSTEDTDESLIDDNNPPAAPTELTLQGDSNSTSPVDEANESAVLDSTLTEQPVYPAIMDIREESAPSPTKPAELAKVNEHLSGAVPTKMTRSPMRRPLLHRRFQMERPATTSSTGSENVNRKLRVDQPGGTNDAPETAPQAADFIASSVASETKIVSNALKPGRRFRIDGAESVDSVTGTDGRRGRTQTLPKHRYIDDAHDSTLRGPHFEITAPRRSNLTSVTGQFLAYLGVLGLTIGTAMVIYGHFGGYSEYTPTGWLVTTVAQMLLFLGVINLVSGGIEQNNEDVSRRINTLGEQLVRIEKVTTDVLKGPKLSPRLYDDPNAEVEESARETANVQRD